MNPFDLPGPTFLVLYAVALAALFLTQFIRRWRFDTSSRQLSKEPLSPYEIAYVTGGAAAVIDAAVTTLAGYGLLDVQRLVFPGSGAATPVRRLPPLGAFDRQLEQEVLAAVPEHGVRLKTLREKSLPALLGLEERLVALELVFPSSSKRLARLHDVALVVLLLAGAIKIAVGLARDRPVVFLILLVACTGVYAAWLANEPRLLHPTRRGVRRLQALRDEHAALRVTGAAAPGQLLPHETGLAYALFGSTMLGGSLLGFRNEITALGSPVDEQNAAEEEQLRASFRQPNQGSNDSGSGGCGGGGGGGGGCGGGGCGGCGGD